MAGCGYYTGQDIDNGKTKARFLTAQLYPMQAQLQPGSPKRRQTSSP
jgi:hypothetical protein